MLTRKNSVWLGALVGLVAVAGGCSSSDAITAAVPHTLTVSGGSGQTGTVGQPLPTPIAVTLKDQNGKPIPGATINWTPSDSGTVASPSSTTDSTGTATVVWTLGTTAGVDSLTAADPFGPKVVITATATGTPAATIVKVSGDSQSVAAGTAAQPLVIKVADASGNPVQGVTVNFATTGGGTLSATSAVTNASGQAQVVLTTGATAGANTVTVTSGSLAAVTFTITGS